MQEFPDEVHFVDMEPFFSSPHLRPGFGLTTRDQHVREVVVHLDKHLDDDDDAGARPPAEMEMEIEMKAHRQLLLQPAGKEGAFGFVLYDEKRDAFYYSKSQLLSASKMLWAQNRQTKQRLSSVKKVLTSTPILVTVSILILVTALTIS